MSEVGEAMGTSAEGGLFARALSRRAGTRAKSTGHFEESACLNCATPLIGSHCHVCGQAAHLHRTLGAFLHDLLHGALHFEGKTWRTLPLLMLRPGQLMRRYIAGERARFVSPMALFLFTVFLTFAVMSLFGSPTNMFDSSGRNRLQVELRSEAEAIDDRLFELRRQRAATAADGADTRALDDSIGGVENERSLIRSLLRIEGGSAAPAIGGDAERQSDGIAVEGPGVADDADRTRRVTVGETSLIGFQPRSAFDIAYRAAKSNPSLLVYKLQNNAYKFSWALIMISVPFVALLFLWRRRPIYDHAVFVTYSITAASIFLVVGALLVLAGLPAAPLAVAGTVYMPWHMYRQLRGGYDLTRFSAAWRMILLTVFASIALGIFAITLLVLGVLG